MSERGDTVLPSDYPWPTQSGTADEHAGSTVIELDQAVRHLQDLARVRLAAPAQPKRRRRKSRA